MNNNYKHFRTSELVAQVISFMLIYVMGQNIFTSLGLAVSIGLFLRFFNNIGKTIDVRDLIVLISAIQWIIGPWLSYNFSTDNVFYFMVIDEALYMRYVVPAFFVFYLGMYISFQQRNYNTNYVLKQIQIRIEKNNVLDVFFIIMGIIANLVIPIAPPSLMFIVFLIGNIQYVGLFLLLQNNNRKNKRIIFISVIIIMSLLALARGMFQNLLLWFTFLFVIVSFIEKMSQLKKVAVIFVIFVVAIFIQSIKTEYRSIIWSDDAEGISNTTVFAQLIGERLDRTELLTSDKNLNNIIARMNQGWIIARVMQYTPAHEPFAEGKTIVESITASLLPRFLFPNKKIAGGKENFTKYTGRKLVGGTSMNLSVLGEVYANFGVQGGILFMFVFGLFINLFYSFIMEKTIKNPVLLFFVPFVFFQVVKAETDFGMVLNYLLKASIFVWILFVVLRKIFNVKI